MWGESKNVLRSIVYFKFALLGNQKQSIKIDLDLAIKNDAKIRERIIKLSQNNPKDKRLEVIVGLLDK